jgi:hypothetical protein
MVSAVTSSIRPTKTRAIVDGAGSTRSGSTASTERDGMM